jgi:hypothetical protein
MSKRRESKMLETTSQVMAALGGPHPVAALTGADYKTVWPWKDARTFPARYFLVMSWALHRKRLSAPPELWGQVTPAERQQALSAMIAQEKQRRAA